MLEKHEFIWYTISDMAPHYVTAKQLRDEYERISGKKPLYPRSKVALEQLRAALEELKREGKSETSGEKQPSGSGHTPSRLEFERSKWVVGNYLRAWKVVVPQGHSLSADPKSFLEGVSP